MVVQVMVTDELVTFVEVRDEIDGAVVSSTIVSVAAVDQFPATS